MSDWEWCDYCDGCGWHECSKCARTGKIQLGDKEPASPPAPVEPSPIERLRRGIGAVRCDGAYPVEHDLAAVEEAFRRLQEENERLRRAARGLLDTALSPFGRERRQVYYEACDLARAALRGSEPSARPATQEETK